MMSKPYDTCLLFFYQSPRVTRSTCAGCPPDTMYILAHVHGRIVIDNMRHMLDIYTARYEVGTDEPKKVLMVVSSVRQ
jgi:hypothetical protein